MKSFKLFFVLASFVSVVLFNSCGDDACKDVTCLNGGDCIEGICDCPEGFVGSDCGTSCGDVIFGTWNVTDIRPIGCTLLTYEFGTGISSNIISVTLDDGTRVLDGEGLLDADCTALTYTVSGNGDIVSGSITFNGSTLIDMSGLGCLITAVKQ